MAVFSKYPNGIRKTMNIGHKIEMLRKYKGITREELAERLGVTPTTVYRKERGQGDSARAITLKELPKWAKALDSTVEEIMNTEEYPGTSDREFGIISVMQLLFSIIAARNLVTPENLQELLTQQARAFQAQNRPGAIEVTETLIEALGLKPHESKIEAVRKLLRPVQA